MQSTLNIICLDTPAFHALIDEVVQKINIQHTLPEKKWILSEDAMELLGISSRTTLQKLRDEGKLRFSCPGGKIYFYDRESIDEYITSKAIDTF
jgi:hypothetical protein